MSSRCQPQGEPVSGLVVYRQDHRSERGRIRALILARPLALTLAVGFGIALNGELFTSGAEAGAAILLISYALTGLYFSLSLLGARPVFQLGLQMVLDVALITALVSVTGGVDSQYLLLYFVLVLYASMYLSFYGALAASALSAAAYLLSWSPVVGWPQIFGAGMLGREMQVMMLFHCLLFMTVGVLSGFLARRVEQKDRKLQDTASELRRVRLGTDVILESIGSGIMSIDSTGKVVHFNRAASEILGLPASDVQNRHFEDVLEPGMSGIARVLRRGLNESQTVFRGEMEITSGNGRKVPIGINTSLILTESGEKAGVVALYQNLTEAKRMEEVAKRQERLAALGEFSSGIAHEIRNCLSPIAGSVELLKDEVSLDGDSGNLMALILKETERLEAFLTELLLYGRGKTPEKQPVQLRGLLEETLELARRHPAYSERKVIECSFQAPDFLVELDREQMKGVFMNLVVNALEAIEEEGRLLVSTYLDSGDADGRSTEERAVVVEFSDSGVGISPENLHRILEPFHSTKKCGTGLGLSIAHRVIERHGGRFSIESSPGHGCKVRVYIPCSVADKVDMAFESREAA